jgi:hypothetical protein
MGNSEVVVKVLSGYFENDFRRVAMFIKEKKVLQK